MPPSSLPTAAALRDALREVLDPELGVDIVTLGLVARLDLTPAGHAALVLRPTSPTCPLGDHLARAAEAALRSVPGVTGAAVALDRGLADLPAAAARPTRLGVPLLATSGPATPRPLPPPRLATRAPFLLAGLAALVTGVWGGMARVGGDFPLPAPAWLELHGPLMVSGFLGAVITLERAVGVGWRWAWLAPLLAALGALALLLPLPPSPAPAALATAGSALLVAVYAAVLSRRPSVATAFEGLGALAWLAGNLAWLAGAPFFLAVPWWLGFLVLTIVGERVELARALRPLDGSALLLPAGALLLLTGALAGHLFPSAWPPLVGAGLAALALWLLASDIAWQTARGRGLPRFTALCLLTGYGWLSLGALLLVLLPIHPAGPAYDAALHAVFVGFVMAMIFGHAPIIFPAVLGRAIPYSPLFYVHLALLQGAIAARLIGDLTGHAGLRIGGAHATAAALALFLFATATAVVRGRRAP